MTNFKFFLFKNKKRGDGDRKPFPCITTPVENLVVPSKYNKRSNHLLQKTNC